MTAVATLTGALSHRMTVPGLQARMVKVGPQPGVRRGTTAFRKERSQGLSGMQGNLHVPFLGGWAGAIPPGYPANFTSVVDLRERILAFIAYFNKTMAKPFKWTYKGRPLTV